jgi:2-phosphosulfolactate phosphatase
MEIRREFGIEGGSTATGATVIVDVFRAFSAAAYAFSAGATSIVLASAVDEARSIAAGLDGAVLMGEDGGLRPEGFDIGNSPGEIMERPDRMAGRIVVHRSTAGTRTARAALEAGAAPVYVASLVVASATAAALAGERSVTIVESGTSGVAAAEEDAICADLIADLLVGRRADPEASGTRVASSDRARFLDRSSFAHRDDVPLCAATDRFSFTMLAAEENDLVVVRQR